MSKNRDEDLADLMERASEALTHGRYFECERLADEALHRAWKSDQFELISRIVLPLQEARRQRRINAVEAGRLVIIEQDDRVPGVDDEEIAPGCYIVMPPRVGADARQIRIAALEKEVAVIALAREPVTQMGLLPVVSVGPIALRARIRPPREMAPSWCLEVIDALTSEGLSLIDETRPLPKQIDAMIDLLDALPESEQVHQELARLAHEAAREQAEEQAGAQSDA